ncbi:hypothetical protein [Flavobacterium pedocola]
MAFTNLSDVFASVHEDGFNQIIEQIAMQRPSLFHYGTESFVKNPKLLCCPPKKAHPEVIKRGNPIVSRLSYLPIPGYPGGVGLEFNFSLSELQIDFEPTNKFNLPPELGVKLPAQAFAIKAIVCGGIACPDPKDLDQFIVYPEPYRPDLSIKGNNDTHPREFSVDVVTPKRGLPFNPKNIHCFKIGLFAVLNLSRSSYLGEPVLEIKLQNLELVDIKPDGLENSMECFLKTTLRLGILPQIRISLNALVLKLGDFISIEPAAITASLPNNPSVANDSLSVFLNLKTP